MESIKRMEREGVIQGYHVVTGYEELGQSFYKVWLNLKNMDASKWKMMRSFLSFEPDVIWATRLIGGYDYSIEFAATHADLMSFLKRFRKKLHGMIKRKDVVTVSKEEMVRYFGGKHSKSKKK